MIRRLLSLFALAAIVSGLQTGCERHPASQTVPGFKETQAREQEALDLQGRKPTSINLEAPKFFPPGKEQ